MYLKRKNVRKKYDSCQVRRKEMEVKNVYEVMKEELIAGLLKIFGNNISMIILYGSVARNEYTDESDIDIAIILKNEIDNKTKEQFINWSADMDIRYDRVFLL